MNTIKLNTSRDKTFVGLAMPYRIIINGIEMQNEYRKQNVFRTAKNTINIKGFDDWKFEGTAH